LRGKWDCSFFFLIIAFHSDYLNPDFNDRALLCRKKAWHLAMKISTTTRDGSRLLFELARSYGCDPVEIGEIAKRSDLSVMHLLSARLRPRRAS
jgi:hypothetical protein